MTINPENDLNKPGHIHTTQKDAEIVYLPLAVEEANAAEEVAYEDSKWAMSAKLGVGVITAYSFGIVGYQGYLAYESLEGNDLVVANATGAIAVAGAFAAGAITLFRKIRN